MLHSRFGKFFRSKTTEQWWSVDKAGHGGSAFKVFKESGDGLRWIEDADQFGTFISGKHKGSVGMLIPWADLRRIK
jgi:hypothetical protein